MWDNDAMVPPNVMQAGAASVHVSEYDKGQGFVVGSLVRREHITVDDMHTYVKHQSFYSNVCRNMKIYHKVPMPDYDNGCVGANMSLSLLDEIDQSMNFTTKIQY